MLIQVFWLQQGELLAIDEIDAVRLGMIREVLAAHGFELRVDS